MYKYGGYIYNHDGTDIVEDPDCLDYDPDAKCDLDQPDLNDEEDEE